jgi:hypothetical protein
MPEYRMTIPYHTVRNGQVIKQEVVYYDGERFLYADYPDYTSTIEMYGEWSILASLCDIILYHRPFCIVELGAGASTPFLAQSAERFRVDMHSVDIKPWKARLYKGKFHYHNMLIEDFMKDFNETPAIVLIDANHDYEVAKKEFEFFFDKLVEGGVIFLHDTYPPCERMLAQNSCSDVYRLRQDIEKMDKNILDVFTWPYTAKWCGLTMVIKKEKERPFWGQ